MAPSPKSDVLIKDLQLAALLASVAVVLGFAVYWTLQIQAVREMLALAYG